MRCREVEALLARYADDALPRREREAVGAHLESCVGCRRELALLQDSLGVLSRASRTGAPDLWSRFQTRLAREAGGLPCARVEELLPAYAEGALTGAVSQPIAAHLESCAACAAEERLLARSLQLLESVPAPVPDLWPAFSARLAETLPCEKCEEGLAGYLDGALAGNLAASVRAHLEQCGPCRAGAARMETALAALDRVAAQPVEVDLWPAFASRLAQERPRVTIGQAVRSALAQLVPAAPARGLVPAAGLAAMFALILFGSRPANTPGGPRLAQNPIPIAPRAAEPASPALNASTPQHPKALRVASRSGSRRHRVGARPLRLARTARMRARRRPVLAAAGQVKTQRQVWTSPVRLARNTVADVLPAAAAEMNSRNAQKEVMPEVVHAVELLVGVEDASVRPFEISNHER